MSNKINKIIYWVFIILFISTFSYFFGGEYLEFYKANQQLEKQNITLEEEIKSFSLDKVRDFESIVFRSNPDTKLLDDMVVKIDWADNRVYLEVYLFTEKRIKEAIKKAYNRWVDVKVLLESNPYMSPSINDKFFEEFEKMGIDVTWSNPDNYSLNHSKFMIVDDEVVVSTWNYSYATFAYNRDFFVFIKDEEFLGDMLDIFLNDFSWNNVSFYNHNLVLSPVYSRLKLEMLINSADEKLQMYFPYMGDDSIKKLIYKKVDEGVSVSLIVSTDVLKEEEDKKEFEEFEKNE